MALHTEIDAYRAAQTIQRFVRGFLARCIINSAFDELDECAHEIEQLIQRKSLPTYSVEITRDIRCHIISDLSCGYYMNRSCVYTHPVTTADAEEMKLKIRGAKVGGSSRGRRNMTEITEAEAPIVVPDSRAVDKSFQNVTSSQSPENTRSLLDGPSVGVEAPSSTLKNLDDDALISRALQLEKLIQSRIQLLTA